MTDSRVRRLHENSPVRRRGSFWALPGALLGAYLVLVVLHPETSVAPAARALADKAIRGVASWYGAQFHGRPTASGEPFDMNAMTAAHRTLPLGSRARVVNLENGRSVEVRITDRGPYVGQRVIDLSYEAARELGMAPAGTAQVEVVPLAP
jgi:rare lipoprotein A (peptidoglycan hydrolase)